MREENIFGVPMTIIEDGDEQQFQRETGGIVTHMCTRVEDARWLALHPKSIKPWPALLARRVVRECSKCTHRVWVDPNSIPKGVIPIHVCERCMMPGIAPKLDEMIAEIKAKVSPFGF